MDAQRPAVEGTRSVPGCIPTRSVGTIYDRPRGNDLNDLRPGGFKTATRQHRRAGHAFRGYNARLDRDSLTKKTYVLAQTSPGTAQPRP